MDFNNNVSGSNLEKLNRFGYDQIYLISNRHKFLCGISLLTLENGAAHFFTNSC
jgi:hypothetical protein